MSGSGLRSFSVGRNSRKRSFRVLAEVPYSDLVRTLDPINQHRLFRDGALLIFENHGDFTLEDAERATVLYSQIIKEEGYLHLLLDHTDSVDIDGRSRKHLASWGKANSAHFAMATVGGNIAFRTTFTLIVNAVRLLSDRPLRVRLCASRQEALAWLTVQKRHTSSPTLSSR